MYFDYRTKNNLFLVKINNNKFITDNVIESIDIGEKNLIVIFKGEQQEFWFSKNETEIIDTTKILNYFKDEYHTVCLQEFNKQGFIIKETIFYKTEFKSITTLEKNRYKLILEISNIDKNFIS